jgi:hypothetical protein
LQFVSELSVSGSEEESLYLPAEELSDLPVTAHVLLLLEAALLA